MGLIFGIIIIVLLLLSFLLLYSQQKQSKAKEDFLKGENYKLNQEAAALRAKIETITANNMTAIKENATLKAQLEYKQIQLTSQQAELTNTREQLSRDFRILANRILEESSSKITDINKTNIETILKPLNEKLTEFKTKVEETYDKESKQRFSLEERIRELVTLNHQISEDANNLTKALKGNNKIQGNWGEMILESILERSGLKRDENYFVQSFIKDENGNKAKNEENKKMQPDIIIIYPGGRKIVVDSKVSLNAFLRYVEAGDEDSRAKAIKEHLTSVKQHIDELSAKSYQDYIESLDFVMMFIPNESAYMLAMQADANLWDYAYRKRILLLSSTNLIASLKVVEDLWKREYQNRNAMEIAKRGTILLDKITGFLDTFNEVGRQIEKTHKSFEKADSQLRFGNGNLIRQAELLQDLGVKCKKELPNTTSL